MLNIAVIMGRLVADPELRHTPSDIPVTRIRVAVDRSYAKQGTERQTDFIDVTAWRSTAEFICKYFRKGSMIAVSGRIQTGSYTNNEGIKRNTFEIVADEVNFTGSKAESGTGGGNYGNQQGGNQYGTGNYNNPQGGNQHGTGSSYSDDQFGNPPPADNNFTEPAPTYQSGSNEDFEEVIGDDDLPF